jgi:hypothetical protein
MTFSVTLAKAGIQMFRKYGSLLLQKESLDSCLRRNDVADIIEFRVE